MAIPSEWIADNRRKLDQAEIGIFTGCGHVLSTDSATENVVAHIPRDPNNIDPHRWKFTVSEDSKADHIIVSISRGNSYLKAKGDQVGLGDIPDWWLLHQNAPSESHRNLRNRPTRYANLTIEHTDQNKNPTGKYLDVKDSHAYITADKSNAVTWMLENKRTTILVIGAGNRGGIYSIYAAENPSKCKLVAVCDPKKCRTDPLAKEHHLDADQVFTDWKPLLELPRFADAAVICLPDKVHAIATIPFLERDYHILLEKPMATTLKDCQDITQKAQEHDSIMAICHVMRYTPYSRKFKEIIDSKVIGDIVNIEHLEPIGFYHFAHSYVRGNWRNTEGSSFSLLAKSCHDIDWIKWIIGKKCLQISSFGSLKHFRAENKPQGAGNRCLQCPVESSCPYSAKKIYIDLAKTGHKGWPLHVVVDGEITVESVIQSVETNDYGRCVYSCDNDVVDNQVVIMQFEDGVTSSFSMIAFTKEVCVRKTRIFGTMGQLEGDGSKITHFDFLTRKEEVHYPQSVPMNSRMNGHDFGDYYLMQNYINALVNRDFSHISSGVEETLESHALVFHAEESRLSNKIVHIGTV